MLGRTRSRGRRPRSQVPEVRGLEESRVRGEDGGDDTAAAVEKATRQDVVARESPQRPGGQVPGGGAAAARVQVLGSPAGVQDDLLEMVRQIAVRGVADTATELARIGNALEGFVHAGLDEASRPLGQAHVPVEPPSATMTSSAQRSDVSASAIYHASLRVGITTVRGSEAGNTEGTGGARSGMTSSGCERSGLRLGCWSRGCPLIIQHAFRRHTVVMTTLLLAHDFPPLGGGIARLHGELARRYPAGELIVSTPQDPDAADVDAQYNGAVDRLPIGRRTTKSLPGLLLWSRRAASLARRHHVRFVHCGNVKPAGYPARWVLERCRVRS